MMRAGKGGATVSEIVATARIYAILSVVCAHLSYSDSIVGDLFVRLGTIGVVVFLISSGYYFVPAKFNSLTDLIKSKAKSMCVPWLALGSLVWVYNVLLSSKFRSPVGYLKWIFGNGTYLYYIPVLLVCFLICYKLPRRALLGLVIINVVSVILTASGVLAPVIDALHITSYLNFFNWVGFFALGMLLRGIDEAKILSCLKKIRIPAIILFVMALVATMKLCDEFSYFIYVSIPYELLGALAVFSVSTLPLVRIGVLARLSESTYAIYLVHMILIGLLDSVFSRALVLQAVSSAAIVAVAGFVLLVGSVVSEKIKLNGFYCLITGLRTKK